MQKQLTKVQYVQSIQLIGGNIVVTNENAAQTILSPTGVLLFESGILYAADPTTVIKALTDPNNISD